MFKIPMPSKHGPTKAHIIAVWLFDNTILDDGFKLTTLFEIPVITYIDYALLGIEDDFLVLQSESGHTREDIWLYDHAGVQELNDRIKSFIQNDIPSIVTIMCACGKEVPVAVREDKSEL